DDGVHYFEAVALPFGGKSSVTGFNRMARSLKLIMSRLMWLVNTSYYDDFCQVECDELSESASETAEQDEGRLVTRGAVMFDLATGCQEFFGDGVPGWLVTKWRRTRLKQLIFFAEILPVLVAKLTWKHVVSRRLCFFYLDNEATRSCLIRSFSPVCDATDLLVSVAKADLQSHAMSWYSRVPTRSNVSDDASRLQFSRYLHMFRKVDPVYEGIR
ncbi:unnamed protein product, partial [Symbiodinium pilosum]